MDENLKYELVKYRHQDQAKLSLHLSDTDFKVFSGYLTLQLALCSFIIYKVPEMEMWTKIGFALIDFVLSLVAALMLYSHYCRRVEVVETIKNCNEFLKYNKKGFYLNEKAINGKTKNRFWFPIYFIAIVFAYIAFDVILFSEEINCFFC